MSLQVIEYHPQRVLEAFRQGQFDQIEIIGEADEKEFFELCLKEKILLQLAEGMPTAREKEEVPLWFVLAANLSLKLHQENSFSAFERVVRCGGLLSALALRAQSWNCKQRLGPKPWPKSASWKKACSLRWRNCARLNRWPTSRPDRCGWSLCLTPAPAPFSH